MAGYDDTQIINAARSMLVGNPGLSRRAAIIAVAGEQNLRRIEMKMRRMDIDAPNALDAERRAALARAHASRYPARLVTSRTSETFIADAEDVVGDGRPYRFALGLHDRAVSGSFAPEGDDDLMTGYRLHLDRGKDPGATFEVLVHLGVIPGGPDGSRGGIYGGLLADDLARSWRERGMGAHLDDGTIAAEAAGAVGERLDAGGLGTVLGWFPEGFGEAVAPFADPSRRGKVKGPLDVMDWLMREPGAIGLVRELGPLAGVMAGGMERRRFEAGASVRDVLWAVLRHADSWLTSKAHPSEIPWLLRKFAPVGGTPLLDMDDVRALIEGKQWIDAVGGSQEDMAALVALVAAVTTHETGHDGHGRLFSALGFLVPAGFTMAEVRQGVEGYAKRAGLPVERVVRTLCLDFVDLWRSVAANFGSDVMREVGRRLGEDARRRSGATDASGMAAALEGRSVEVVLAMITRDAGVDGLLRLAHAYAAEGYPGYVPDDWTWRRFASKSGTMPFRGEGVPEATGGRDDLFGFLGKGADGAWREHVEALALSFVPDAPPEPMRDDWHWGLDLGCFEDVPPMRDIADVIAEFENALDEAEGDDTSGEVPDARDVEAPVPGTASTGDRGDGSNDRVVEIAPGRPDHLPDPVGSGLLGRIARLRVGGLARLLPWKRAA